MTFFVLLLLVPIRTLLAWLEWAGVWEEQN
jgi:hypothetical protein